MSNEIVHKESKYPTSDEFLGTVSKTFHTIDSADLNALPPYLLAKGAEAASADRLKQRIMSEVQKYDFDVQAYVSQWLNLQRSAQTRRAYQRSWDTFQIFLGLQAQNIHLFDVNRDVAKKFLLYLRDKHHDTRATIELRMSAIQSLYSSLIDDRLLTHNPFRHLAKFLPVETPKVYRIPSEQETAFLLDALTGWKYAAFLLIANYGIRVGLLPTLRHDDRGQWFGTSKNKTYAIRTELYKSPIQHEEISNVILMFLDQLTHGEDGKLRTSNRIRVAFAKQFKKYHKAGNLKHVYSPHDWRHAVAKREYAVDHDIDRVRKIFHHVSIETTQRYLQELSGL